MQGSLQAEYCKAHSHPMYPLLFTHVHLWVLGYRWVHLPFRLLPGWVFKLFPLSLYPCILFSCGWDGIMILCIFHVWERSIKYIHILHYLFKNYIYLIIHCIGAFVLYSRTFYMTAACTMVEGSPYRSTWSNLQRSKRCLHSTVL